jgi:hypothetical protein
VVSTGPGAKIEVHQAPAAACMVGFELLDRTDFEDLQAILFGASTRSMPLRWFYLQATRHMCDLPSNPDDVFQCIGALCRLTDARPLFEFLARFAAETHSPGIGERLIEWIGRTAPKCGIDSDVMACLGTDLHHAVVLVQLEPDMLGEGWQVTAWVYAGSTVKVVAESEDPWGYRELGELLGEQCAILVDDFDPGRGSTQLTVEFLVGNSMLEDDFEAIPVLVGGVTRSLGTVCAVVVRSLDRLDGQCSRELWHAKWGELQRRGHVYDHGSICWILGRTDTEVVELCAALAHPVEDHEVVLDAVFAAGTPVAVWCRPRSRHRGQAPLEDVLTGFGLLALPQRVMSLRIGAQHPAAGPGHAERDLVLLWEDPNRIPAEQEWHEPMLQGEAS